VIAGYMTFLGVMVFYWLSNFSLLFDPGCRNSGEEELSLPLFFSGVDRKCAAFFHCFSQVFSPLEFFCHVDIFRAPGSSPQRILSLSSSF